MTTPAFAATASFVGDSRYMESLHEAAEWRLLGLLFACPHADWRDQVRTLADEITADDLREAARAAQQEADDALYHTTFGPGGPAAPREVSYQQSTLSGQFLADLRAYYQAFGYCPPHDEPPDHIAVETDFMAYLKMKQAFAVARLQEEQVSITADAAQAFVENHLFAISQRLAETMAASGIQYLDLAAAALLTRTRVPDSRTMALPFASATSAGADLSICPLESCCDELIDD
jgi:nitrate reductase assembly molybdenum cofactor insertion protein NarJ